MASFTLLLKKRGKAIKPKDNMNDGIENLGKYLINHCAGLSLSLVSDSLRPHGL